MEIQDKVIVVTGAASGIGRATAQAFLDAFADVVREVVVQELANFGAEGLLLGCVI